MPTEMQPQLIVQYETEAEFYAEYASNIANGGIFVATEEHFEVRQFVLAVVQLPFCHRSLELEAEVVHVVPPELAMAGAKAGVALQFRLSARQIRAAFEPLSSQAPSSETASDNGRRRSPRSRARVHAAVESSEGTIQGRTRNLSSSGVLLTVRGRPIGIGEVVQLTINHPQTGEKMKVKGEVRRHLEAADGRVAAMGIAFDPDAEQAPLLDAFIREIGRAEHSGRLGGISGPIAELGIENLLQMFGTSAPRGTVTLTRGAEEGYVAFENGMLRVARLGPLSGDDALLELMSWREGEFDFQARIDECEPEGECIPLSGAILDAICRRDEIESAPSPVDPTAQPRPAPSTTFTVRQSQADKERAQLGKTEEAVLDLAMVGMSISQMIGVIPEPEADVLHAIDGLRERGLIS